MYEMVEHHIGYTAVDVCKFSATHTHSLAMPKRSMI